MGITESSSGKSYSHFLKGYTEIAQMDHENFGQVRILEHNVRKGEKIIEKVFNFADEESYNQGLKIVELKAATKWPFYCKIVAFHHSTQWGCMQGHYVIYLALEYFERSVYQVALNGSLIQDKLTPLDESVGWKILIAMSQLCSLFKRYNLGLGLISSENVLLTPTDEIRFLDMSLLTFSRSVFDRLKKRSLLVNYPLSPEQLEQVKNGSNHAIDIEKTDIFCIGMFVLCAVLAEPCKTFYDFSTHEIQFELVFKKLMKLKKANFSDEFTDVLVSMLQKDPVQRPSGKDLHGHISVIMTQPRQSVQSSAQN